MSNEPMRLDALSIGEASGIVAALLFILCGIAIGLAPNATTIVVSSMTHVDVTPVAWRITLGNLVGGVVCWGVGVGVVVGGTAAMYNRLLSFARQRPAHAAPAAAR